MKTKTVLLALSGGVDSSVAAFLLKEKGFKVVAVFLKMFSDTKNLKGECAWRNERRFAQQIAAKLEIPLITLDFEKEYKKKIIMPMFKAYRKGKTPNPDIACNAIIKFPFLWKVAKKIKADYIATGHYARIEKKGNKFNLLAGKDSEKDQSYFLAELKQFDLSHTLFPLGELRKKDVRELAKGSGFSNWDKKSTSGICFVGNVEMRKFLKQKMKEKPGKVFSPEGVYLGRHSGAFFYTIGQKAIPNAGIIFIKPKKDAQKRFYVAEKCNGNVLIIAPEGHNSLKKKKISLKRLHLINPKEKVLNKTILVRVRHRGKLHKGRLIKKNNRYFFIFRKPVEAIAEGQYAVFYKKDRVFGCGEI
jgi:tRNA-specific 2-thiouridylase